jgi:hypothetical protein
MMLIWNFIPPVLKGRPLFQWLERRPWVGLFVFVPVMVFAGDRTTGVPDYLQEIRDVILAQKPGAVIVSHPPMRAVAQLAAPREASALNWKLFKNVLQPNPDLTQALVGADGLWLIRKHAWISNRKRSEEGNKDQLSALAPYLVPPFDGWFPARSVLKGDVPDFVFLERAGSPPEPLDISRFLPPLPARWDFDKQPTEWKLENQKIPAGLAGRELFVFLRYASDRTEPVRLWLEFETSEKNPPVLTFKPYLFRDMSPDFFAFRIPSNATSFSLRLKVSKSTKWLEIERMDIFVAAEKRD